MNVRRLKEAMELRNMTQRELAEKGYGGFICGRIFPECSHRKATP